MGPQPQLCDYAENWVTIILSNNQKLDQQELQNHDKDKLICTSASYECCKSSGVAVCDIDLGAILNGSLASTLEQFGFATTGVTRILSNNQKLGKHEMQKHNKDKPIWTTTSNTKVVKQLVCV